jgi:transposase
VRLRHDVLATAPRIATDRGLGLPPSGAARPARTCERHRLAPGGGEQRECRDKNWGTETGTNPTDRGKPDSKRHVIVDANGIPLAVRISAANRHDSKFLIPLVDAVPAIRQCVGRPRRRTAKLHADKGCDFAHCRRELRSRSIVPRITRRGVDGKQRLGRHRWVVERALGWFGRFRRLAVCYERRTDIFAAFHTLDAGLICWRFVQRWFC